jgi:HEAT repeat protein
MPLSAELEDSDSYVRRSAVEAMGDIKDPRAVEPLIAYLKDAGIEEQSVAAEALVKIGTPAVGPLSAVLKVPKYYLQVCVFEALNQMNDERASSAIRAIKKAKLTYRDLIRRGTQASEAPLIGALAT